MESIYAEIIDIETMAKRAGASMNVICKMAGIDRSTFTKWKNGSASPNFSNLLKVRQAIKLYEMNKRRKERVAATN